ncbi:uncharacterized protein LOC130447770 isoform X2 [Diorhabda sublineata]|uniref:uncharacterized protein LOC130447770 isoform X2 n=1 Tax=Diorhabda sublineata TaxID=1163346 RepID=UPI0024E189CD|nr:uncharacterized protein LOC130447770 isoform X2 [Diorhabda sublineata]
MKSIILVLAITAAASSLPIDIIQDENDQEYLVIPLERQKRDLTWGANQNGYSLGQKGTLWSNDHHQVDGEYGASKAWNSHGLKPDSYRGELDYSHKPSGSTAFVAAHRTPGYGTDGAAGLKYSIAQGKNYNVDLTGQYTRHYGGPGGTGKPEGQVLLTGEYSFRCGLCWSTKTLLIFKGKISRTE